MRPLAKSFAILAAIATLVGSACGSASPERKLTAASAIPLSAHHSWREIEPTTSTTTTSTTLPVATAAAATAPRPVDRPARVRPTPQRVTVPVAPVAAPSEGCMRHGEKTVAEAHACWDGLLASYPWDTGKAFRVMMCESKGDTWNVGPSTRYGTAKGLMQVLPDGSFDPATNMAQAWEKYQARGWQPWVCA